MTSTSFSGYGAVDISPGLSNVIYRLSSSSVNDSTSYTKFSFELFVHPVGSIDNLIPGTSISSDKFKP